MRISLKEVYTFLFFLGIFFIPFNSYVGISFLGEYRKDGAIVLFLLASMFFFLDSFFKKNLKIPVKNLFFQFLILFVGWLFISTLLNFTSIYENYLKHTSGFNRFFRQFLALSIALILFVTAYNIFSNYKLKTIFLRLRKILLYSFVFISFYSFIEILILVFNLSFLKSFFQLFDYFPFTETSLDFNFKRISSVAYEPPFLAIYLITVGGWMFSYILTSKGVKKYIPTIVVFILTFFSGSRTALIVVIFQFIFFIGVVFSINIKFQKVIQRFLLLFSALIILLFVFNGKKVAEAVETKLSTLNFKKNLTKSISNRSRFGIQYTSLLVFEENPIVGVGFGQQAYHLKDKYPKWATHNNYEFKEYYLNDKDTSFPPGFNLYTRLLAETGIIGVLIFVSFIFLIMRQCKKLIKSRNDIEKIVPIVLLISFIGFSINWLQFDSFRIYGFWICLALLILQIQQKKIENE
ncbi:O-antigen ligase [Polaribacter sp. AHE13PA]|uniref:O-antigen ligase family protein n=1 Tax=Polaribacter sp. AHE13PA TaxID=2745562 RepID=UPI001C4F1576|nr:O-antigen ligase family protein [Polaribacter sp. AHE13PA]QXP65937.1 O-antigen ligase family protein [Polaribacter sp. AHE13PA]